MDLDFTLSYINDNDDNKNNYLKSHSLILNYQNFLSSVHAGPVSILM